MKEMHVIQQSIPVNVYRELRAVSGLSSKSIEASETGLNNSIYSVMVEYENEIIGMGRIVGDGGCFCQVVDICVHPKMQGKGVGKLIMQYIATYIKEELPETCYTSLIADGDASYLYEKYGFKSVRPEAQGMYYKQ